MVLRSLMNSGDCSRRSILSKYIKNLSSVTRSLFLGTSSRIMVFTTS